MCEYVCVWVGDVCYTEINLSTLIFLFILTKEIDSAYYNFKDGVFVKRIIEFCHCPNIGAVNKSTCRTKFI